MDAYKARALEKELKGKGFMGLTVQGLIDHGKSAAVFAAVDANGQKMALKVFDNELVERYGHEIQEARIRQEIGLKGHTIPGLVKILDGGQELINGVRYFFILMEFIEGKNLKQYLHSEAYPPAFVKKVASAVYKVTVALLEQGIAHRDIKPENIMVSAAGEIIVMDLGVIKLIGAISFSDVQHKEFVGTLCYAPPEFLLREEKDDAAGWMAVNLYQIGALMHDLIMKKDLFADVSPYSNVVMAVVGEAPEIKSAEHPFVTIQLARNLLHKDPVARLKLVPPAHFEAWAFGPDQEDDDISKALEELLQYSSDKKTQVEEIAVIQRDTNERRRIREELAKKMDSVVIRCFKRLVSSNVCAEALPYQSQFSFWDDQQYAKDQVVRNVLYQVKGDLEHNFSQPLFIFVRFKMNERSDAAIDLLGILLTPAFPLNDRVTPQNIFQRLQQERFPPRSMINQVHNPQQPITYNLPAYRVFEGVYGFDQQSEDRFFITLIKIIRKAAVLMEPDVQFWLAQRKNRASGESGAFTRSLKSKGELIYELD